MRTLDERARDRHELMENDPVLCPLLGSADARARDAALVELFGVAEPVMEAIARYYRRREMLDPAEVEDVLSTVRVRLLLKLQRLADGESDAIATFEGYVARLTYNAVNDVFRGRHPHRAMLKKRLREIAMRDSRFAAEATVNGLVCRLRSQARGPVVAPVTPDVLPDESGDALEALLRAAGGPLLLNDVLAELYTAAAESAPAAADAETPLLRLQRREDLAWLWREILLLPLPQRLALLLNLRAEGGGNAIALFVLLGVTTFEGLAQSLGMAAEELAALWSALPLDDLTIGERLGITRQQVINLRKAARKRLGRRRGRQ